VYSVLSRHGVADSMPQWLKPFPAAPISPGWRNCVAPGNGLRRWNIRR